MQIMHLIKCRNHLSQYSIPSQTQQAFPGAWVDNNRECICCYCHWGYIEHWLCGCSCVQEEWPLLYILGQNEIGWFRCWWFVHSQDNTSTKARCEWISYVDENTLIYFYFYSTKNIECPLFNIIVILWTLVLIVKIHMINNFFINHPRVLISLHHTIYKGTSPGLNRRTDNCCVDECNSKKSPSTSDQKTKFCIQAMRNLLFSNETKILTCSPLWNWYFCAQIQK